MPSLIFTIFYHFLLSNSGDYSTCLSTCHSSLLAIITLHKIFSKGKKKIFEKRTSPVTPGFLASFALLSFILKIDSWEMDDTEIHRCCLFFCESWAIKFSWKIYMTLSSARLRNYSPQIYITFESLLHNATGKTPIVIIQYSLNRLNTKIKYNIKNTKIKG